jgi:hypothetical protein
MAQQESVGSTTEQSAPLAWLNGGYVAGYDDLGILRGRIREGDIDRLVRVLYAVKLNVLQAIQAPLEEQANRADIRVGDDDLIGAIAVER